MSDVIVRALQPADLAEVRTLLAELCTHLGERFDVPAAVFEKNAEAILSDNRDYACFVAEDNAPVGFLAMVFYRTLLNRRGTALITELVVASSHRGRGIGALLLSRAFEEAERREMDEIEVGALRKNEGAHRFYRKSGFDQEYVLFGHELKRSQDPC